MANFPEYSFFGASKIASFLGTLVYRDVTSKDIAASSWSREMFLKLFTVCFDEQFIFDSGITDNHFVIFSASLQYDDPGIERTGLTGIFSL